jgi:carbon monoxide dehydrogenase subunit G
MHLEKSFKIDMPRDEVVERLCRDDTLLRLIGEKSEIVESEGDRRTTRTHYTALGREGTATFRFEFLMDGNLRFEKVCDGRVWNELVGRVEVEEEGKAGRSRVSVELRGRTKTLVPEFTIKGPMEEQIATMSHALQLLLADAGPDDS